MTQDYDQFLTEHSMTDELVRAVSNAVPVSKLDTNALEIRDSKIDGQGMFATGSIQNGEVIAAALDGGAKTEAGRYVNHCSEPNAKMVIRNDSNIDLVAIRDIQEEEITTDYGKTLQHIERAAILRLEDAMKDLDGYEPEGTETCPITHHFAPGIYAREMFIPKNCLLTGKIHKTEHLNMLSQGLVTVSNMGESVTMQAPYTFVSPAGTKRAIYAHQDSTWTTIHATDLTDPDEIEDEIIAKDFEELDSMKRIT